MIAFAILIVSILKAKRK
ncbi:MAG: hypothetical protein FWD25_10790 [Clostridia bacterium]|nr:hypothetical protein [Clostridia bacterium]